MGSELVPDLQCSVDSFVDQKWEEDNPDGKHFDEGEMALACQARGVLFVVASFSPSGSETKSVKDMKGILNML